MNLAIKDKMGKMGVSIIGCGTIYKNHGDALRNNDYCELVSVVDINEDRAIKASEHYGCKYHTDYLEMLKDDKVQIVHICTPHYLHGPMAIEAMKAGKHVLVEKPVSLNPEEGREVAKVAKETNRHLGVCFQNRYNPTSVKVMEIIGNSVLGKVKGIKGIVTWYRDEPYYSNSPWRGKWSTEGGGVLINQSIHTLDLLQWFGGKIEKVLGNVDIRTLNNVIEVEDTADATLFFENGARGIFYATNCFTTNSAVEVDIHLEQGSLRISDNELTLTLNGNRETIAVDLNSDTGEKSYWGKSHDDLIKSFHKAVAENNFNGYISASEATKSLEIIEKIYQSSKERKSII